MTDYDEKLVERVARALFEITTQPEWLGWGELNSRGKAKYEHQARVALDVVADPLRVEACCEHNKCPGRSLCCCGHDAAFQRGKVEGAKEVVAEMRWLAELGVRENWPPDEFRAGIVRAAREALARIEGEE